jgi:hypothetical protein
MNLNQPPQPTTIPGVTRGEKAKKLHEPGRAMNNKRNYRQARDATSINPQYESPIDPKMPHMPPA